MKQAGEEGYQTYFYPKNAAIGKNPVTGRTLKAVSLKKREKYSLTLKEQRNLEAKLADIAAGTLEQYKEGTAVINGKTVVQLVDLSEYYGKLLQYARDIDDATIKANVAFCDSAVVFDYVSD